MAEFALPHGYYEADCEAPFQAPLPSVSSRDISIRSRTSFRGTLIGGNPPRQILYESNLEAKFAMLCLTNLEVVYVEEQQPVEYVDASGVVHDSVFDFCVTFIDGRRIAFAVKQAGRAHEKDFEVFLAFVAAQTPVAFADGIKMITEDHLDPRQLHNARLILCARREPVIEHDNVIRRLIEPLNGSVSIEALVAASGLCGNGFRAIIRLIDLGELKVAGIDRIDYSTLVRKS